MSRGCHIAGRLAFALAVAAALLGAFAAHLGYFGGPIFVPVAATAAPAPSERGLAAILLSGDMGFNIGMGPRVATRLAADGIPVIGVNSLAYFRTRRTPAQAGALVREAMRRALALPGTSRVVLIGQSFGADMLHVGLTYLPPAARRRILMVALIVPGDTVDFRASPAEMLDLVPSDAPALPTAKRLDWAPLLCVRGAAEQHSLCPLLDGANVTRIALPGGHPLRRDDARLHAVLLQAIRRADRAADA